MENIVCQSCGMPIAKDPHQGGTHADNSKTNEYCSYCFTGGKFTDEGITLEQKMEKNIRMAVEKLNIPENQARAMALNTLPHLKRWKNNG
jgi:hypothetical protein